MPRPPIAGRLVGDEAEDAVQVALLKAYRAFDRLEHAAAGPARIPLALVYVDGFATKEVARTLEAPLGTVLGRLHRGLRLSAKICARAT